MKKTFILFMFMCCGLASIEAQNVHLNEKNFIEIDAISSFISTAEKSSLDVQFSAFDVYEIDLPALRALVLKNPSQANLMFNFPDKKPIELSVYEHELRSEDYRAVAMTEEGPVEMPRIPCHTYAGLTSTNENVRLSITEKHFSGFVKQNGKVLFIESLGNFIPEADRKQIIAYYAADQFNSGIVCSEDSANNKNSNLPALKDESKVAPGSCNFIEFATDADVEFFTANFGSELITNITILANMNNAEGLYFNQFDLNFIVTFQIVRMADPDPYTESGPGSGAVKDEIEEEWSTNTNLINVTRDYVWLYTGKTIPSNNGNTNIGGSVMSIGSVCENPGKSYGFIASPTTLVFAHELGHALDAEHGDAEDCEDGDPFPTIMCPTAVGNLVWSPANKNKIANHISNGNCLDHPTLTSNNVNQTFENTPINWTQVVTDDMDWTRTSGSTTSSNTGPTGAYQRNSYFYTEASGNFNQSAQIISDPYVVCQPNLFFSFGYHMYGSNMGTLTVDISVNNGGTWNTVWTRSANQGNVWHTASIGLNNFNTETIVIRITGLTGNSFRSDIAIDDLAIGKTCSVTPSTLLVVFPATGGTETVTVTSAGEWEAHHSLSETWVDLIENTNSSSFTLTAVPNTSTAGRFTTGYLSCGPTLVSISIVQSGVQPNTDPCGPNYANIPNVVTFETTYLNGWTQDGNDDIDWRRHFGETMSSQTGPASAAQGSFYMYTEASGFSNKVANLVSPCYDLSQVPSPQITFSYHMRAEIIDQMGNLKLEVSQNGGYSWFTIWSRSGHQGLSWINEEVSLSDYTSVPIQLRFNGTTGPGFRSDMAIDNIQVKSGVCYDPYENNNVITSAYATTIGTNVTYNDPCLSQGDKDFYRYVHTPPDGINTFYVLVEGVNSSVAGDYRLTVDKFGGSLIIETHPQNGSTTDTRIFLFSNSGQLMAQDDNSGQGNFSKIMARVPLGPAAPRTAQEIVESFELRNYPNPFNQFTNFEFNLDAENSISLTITDINGKVVARPITDVVYTKGNHVLEFDASALPAGVYNYSLITKAGMDTKQMVIVR